jgi:hypothetical protein
MACPGDSSQICGGGWRMRVYSSSSSASSGTSTSSSTSVAASPSASMLPNGWRVAQACAIDTSTRVLNGYNTILSSNTPTACIKKCANEGYAMAGTQYGQECWCSNSYNGGTPSSASVSDCNVPCLGDSSQTCGGAFECFQLLSQ